MHIFRSGLFLAALSLSALPVNTSAATAELFFSGTLDILEVPEVNNTNFFSVGHGETVSGRFVFDLSRVPEDIQTSGNQQLSYSSGASFSREFSWATTVFDQSNFNFDRTRDTGLDKDVFRIDRSGPKEDELFVADAYNEKRSIRCDGRGSDYCWGIRLNALVDKGTLALDWPQTFDLGAGDLTEDLISLNLFNTNADYGDTGFMAAFIRLDSLSIVAPVPPAPVPLPAALWLFLTGLTSLLVFTRTKKTAIK